MNTKPHFVSVFLIFSLLFSSYSTSVSAQEVEDERDFDYLDNSGKGPMHWGDLKKEWAACKHGDLQSPIDMSSYRVMIINKYGDLKRRYKPCDALVKNRGHDISIKWPDCDAGSIEINGTEYSLQQAHWHSPSEHTGRRYAIELHMVHQSKDPNLKNNIAVVGQLYRFGAPDAFLSKLMSNITSMADNLLEREVGVIDPNTIKMGGKKYYRYMGSLTVPPCSEGVIWTMNKKIRTVSRDQVRALRIAVHDYAEANARPVQPLNRRQIKLYSPN
ncbi:Alpha carbonic anhydrase 7 [Hibiscus syriacus]|uniref:Alpha carbonic anhydrase 7 n=1 Tax=Hibiscus syriacus TaxID=106335 RepID=A0A6A3BUX3_HIBSY|nr:alpha carbonic anhydrase 7-like [Hibiscus syriacus]KAE8720335.1 Alpha carbonic anhydrase 7 [Hibiscus syriacus]